MARWISAELRQTVADRAKQLCERKRENSRTRRDDPIRQVSELTITCIHDHATLEYLRKFEHEYWKQKEKELDDY